MAGGPPKKKTLCWDCANYLDGCSWARYGIPVAGWDADISYQMDSNGKGPMKCFCVNTCPKFVRDAYKGGLVRLEAVRDISA